MTSQETDDGNASEMASPELIRGSNAITDGELVVVSNRQPYSHSYDGDSITVDVQAGGLTAGLDPVMQEVGGTWIAWGDGEADQAVVDEDDCVPAPPDDPGYTLKRIWLSEEEVTNYYNGFSNQVLWPICHSALTKVDERESHWNYYNWVNERFADAVVEQAADDSIVWFQDYHFSLAPALVSDRLADDAVLMHFWHIPWPAWDTFRGCPHAETLIEGLLGNSLLAFHVARYCENFLECVEAAVSEATVDHENQTVTYQDRVTRVTDFPLGVPVDDIERRASSDDASTFWQSVTEKYDIADTVAVGVDRLDYSKGIPERLQALELFWERNPDWREEVTYVQNGSETRSYIPAYQQIQERINAAVDRVNDRFGTDSWTPVVSFNDYISKEELAGLYRYSDIALVSPIRDGMNLVAHEYVAAQIDDDGVLLLSDQTGAKTILDGAVQIRPQDTGGFADAIERALTMREPERRARMERLREQVAANDLQTWTELHLEAAVTLHEAEQPDTEAGPLVGRER